MAAFKMSFYASVNGWNEVSGRPGELADYAQWEERGVGCAAEKVQEGVLVGCLYV